MTKGRLLPHGTLLFSSDLGVLDRITTLRKNDCFQSKGTQSAICPVTNIREHLARPMTMRSSRYNQQLSNGSLLVEVGTHGNTLQEALAGARLFARAAGQVLLGLKE